MNNSIKTICIIAAVILIYLIITVGIPFEKEDLTITYYSAMAIVKAILAAAGIIAIAIVCKDETKK